MISTLIRSMLVSIFVLLFYNASVFAGSLDDFEKDAVERKENSNYQTFNRTTSTASEEQECEGIVACIVGGLVKSIFNALIDSALQSSSSTSEQNGESAISENTIDDNYINSGSLAYSKNKTPHLNLSMSVQQISSYVSASHFQFELSNGSFNWQANISKYKETEPEDSMQLNEFKLVYRMPLSHSFDIGFGAGLVNLKGNQSNSGLAFNLPLYYQVNKAFNFELNTSVINLNGNEILDFDGSANYYFKNVGVKAGFRTLKSISQSLSGPYAGVSIRF